MTNPYQPPVVATVVAPSEQMSQLSVRLRIVVPLGLSLVPLWIFESNPELIIKAPGNSLMTMAIFAWLLGMMPVGYGKHDGTLGLWILLLTVYITIRSILVGPMFQPGFPSGMPATTAILIVAVYGAIVGAVCATIYAMTRLVSKRVSRRLTARR